MIYIFEGMDNCLKDTLIQKLRSHLSPQTQVLKYSSPPPNIESPELWQKEHFKDMFDLLELNLQLSGYRNLILNRAHIGEYVYSPLYRGYDGSWIFDLEKSFLKKIKSHANKIKLFVFYDSNDEQLGLREDGQSFSESNFSKMASERNKFLNAFEKSSIKLKRSYDLSDFYIKSLDEKKTINLDTVMDSILSL